MTDEAWDNLMTSDEFFALGAALDGKACGAIAGALEEDDCFRIYSIYVTPSLRRQGIGTGLLDALTEGISEESETMVYTMSFGDDSQGKTDGLIGFLNAYGIPEGVPENGEHVFTFFAE